MKTTTNWACTVVMAAALLAPPILEGQFRPAPGQSEDFSRGATTSRSNSTQRTSSPTTQTTGSSSMLLAGTQ